MPLCCTYAAMPCNGKLLTQHINMTDLLLNHSGWSRSFGGGDRRAAIGRKYQPLANKGGDWERGLCSLLNFVLEFFIENGSFWCISHMFLKLDVYRIHMVRYFRHYASHRWCPCTAIHCSISATLLALLSSIVGWPGDGQLWSSSS